MRNLWKKIRMKGIAFTLALSMVLSLVGIVNYPAMVVEASTGGELPTIGARSETNSYGDVFLGGNYIEVGVSRHGSFGTEALPTGSGWHSYKDGEGLGLTSDGDGWDVGEEPQTGDFFLPGTPEECWGVAYKYNGSTYQYFVRDREDYYPSGSWKTEPSVKDESNVENGELKAVVTGVTIHDVEIKLTYSFGVDDKFYNTTVEINNKSGEEITDVRFIRSFDPDQDQQVYGDYYTYNKVICNPVSTMEAGGENFAMVVARGYKSLAGFFFLAFDNRARASRGVDFQPYDMYQDGFWDNASVTEYTYAVDSEMELTKEMISSSSSPNGYTYEDDAIAITFAFGTIKNGAGDVCTYASSLDPDVEASLEAVKKAAGISVDPEYGRLEGFEAGSTYEIETYDPEDTEKENPIKKWQVVVAEDGSYTVKDASGNIVDEGMDAVNTGVYFLDEWYGYNLLIIRKGVEGEEDAESEIEAVNPEETVVPEAPVDTLPVVTGKVSSLVITNVKMDQQYRIYDYNDRLISDWFTPSEADVTDGYTVEPIDCGCSNTAEHTHPYYVVTRYAGDDNGLPSSVTSKIKTSPNVTIPKVDSEVDLSDGNVEILTDGLYQQTLEDGTVVRFRYADELKVVQTGAATTNTIKSSAKNASIILSGVNINITDGVTTPIKASGTIKITVDGENRIGTSAANAIAAGTMEFVYAGSTEDVLSIDASEQAIKVSKMMPATVTGFVGKTSAEFENTDGDTVVDNSEFMAFNRPQVVYVGDEMIVENGVVVESALAEFAGTVSYDAKNATLTLDGAEITELYDEYAIYADGDLRINVESESTIDLSSCSYDGFGIYVDGEVTVIGDELNIKKTGYKSSDFYGIYGYDGVNIKNTTNIESDSYYAYGIYSSYGDINVSGGSLSISTPNSDGYGIYADYASVNAVDANIDIYVPYGNGVYVYYEGSSISFADSTATIEAEYGLYGYYYYDNSIKLEGSDVTLYTSEAGIYCESGDVTLTDTILNILPKDADSGKTYYGIDSDKTTINGGDINIEAYYIGIGAETDFSISDGNVDIVAGNHGIYNYYGKVDISGGDICVEGTGSYGIYVEYSSFTVSGGTILAKGNYSGIYSYSSPIDLSKYEGVLALVGNSEDSLTAADISSSYWFNGKKVVNISGVPKVTGVNASNITKQYDGVAVGITVTGVPEGAVLRFRDEAGEYTLTESPKYTEASDVAYTVYFKVSCDGYLPYEGSATITIQPIELDIDATAMNATVSAQPHIGYAADSVTATYYVDDVKHTMDVDELIYEYYTNSGSSLSGAPTAVGKYKLVISAPNSNYVGATTITFEIKEAITLSGTVQWKYAYSYSDDYGNVQSGVVDDTVTQRSKKAEIKLYNNGVLVEEFSYIIDAVAGEDNTAAGSYTISDLPAVVDGVDAHYTLVIVPLVYAEEGGTELKEAESYYVTMSGNNGYIDYIPECFDATWTVDIEGFETIDGIIPSEIYVKVLYAVVKDGKYQKITQMSDSSAVCILAKNEDGSYTATGSYPVWKTQSDGSTYYHRIQVVGYKVNGVYIDTTDLGIISDDANIMEYDFTTGKASNDMKLTLSGVQIPVVEFNGNGGTSEESYILMDEIGGKLDVDAIVATRPGYEHIGWTLDGEVISGEITVDGKLSLQAIWKDIISPEGSVSVEGKASTDFNEDIRFDMYVNKDVSIEIDAEDVGEGVDKVLYYLSDKALSRSEVEALEDAKWNSGTSAVLSKDGKYVVYVKIVDKDGNATYISTQGMVVDKTAPVINGVDNDKIYCQEQEFIVTDDNLNHIIINGTTVDVQDAYELLAGNGQSGARYDIEVLDKAGNVASVHIVINNGHKYDEYEVVEEPTCEEDGYKAAECKYCDDVDTVAIEKLDHDYEKDYTVDKEATCGTEGSKSQHCTRCEARQNVTAIPTIEHDWKTPTFEWSDDLSEAALHFVCEADETHIKEITCTVTSEVTKATCLKTGKIVYTAIVEYAGETLVDTKEAELSVTEHDWTGDWTVIKEATATEEGKKETFCVNDCGQKKVVIIPKTGEIDKNGNIEQDAEVEPEAPITEATLNNVKDELIEAEGVFDDVEKQELAKGEDARVWIEISKTTENTLAEKDKAKIEEEVSKIIGENANITYFEIDLFKQVGDGEKKEIKEPGITMKISIMVPKELWNSDETITRKYKIVRLHEGKVDVIDGEFNPETGELKFETDKFSTYAIIYEDVPVIENNEPELPGTENNDPKLPGLGDNRNSVGFVIMMICGLAMVFVSMKRRTVISK